MQSFSSKLFIGLIKHRHLLKGKLKPEIINERFDVHKFRDDIDKVSDRVNKVPKDVDVQNVLAEGMNCEWLTPQGAPQDKVVLYIHGGGFVSGSCRTHRMHVVKFVRECGLKAFLFDYRLAPEHPFPAAVEDCLSAYGYLLAQGYKPQNIAVMGESAGGTLTLSTLIALRDRGIDLPAAAVSISPVTDLTCRAGSFVTNAKKDVAPMGSWTVWTGYYIAQNDPLHPWLSPLMADLTDLPPVMIHVGTHEIHYDDATNFAKKAQGNGVDITLKVWDGMIHAFPLLSPFFPEARNAMHEIGEFLREHIFSKEQN